MGKIISNDFILNAMISGRTLITSIDLLEDGIFFQSMSYDGTLTPNWAVSPYGPKFKASVKDTSGNTHTPVMTPNSPDDEKLIWNGTVVTFDSNGNSDAMGSFAAGTFFRGVDNGSYYYWIKKNIFGPNNTDSDTIRIEGRIELPGGNFQDFVTPDQPITLLRYSAGGRPYVALITKVVNIESDGGVGALTAFLYDASTMTVAGNSSGPIRPTAWYNVDGTGEEHECLASDGYQKIVDQNTLLVPESKVNGFDNFCAKFVVNNDEYRAYGYLRDDTDGIYVAYDVVGGVQGNEVEEGGTARVKIYVVDKDGRVLHSWGGTTLYPHVVLKADDGTTVTPQTYSGSADQLANTSTSVSAITYKGEAWKGTLAVPYDKLVADCGGRLQGWISLDPNNS